MKVVVAVAALVVGVLAVVLGGADDSPGLQGLGVLTAIGAGAVLLRRAPTRGAPAHGPDRGDEPEG